ATRGAPPLPSPARGRSSPWARASAAVAAARATGPPRGRSAAAPSRDTPPRPAPARRSRPARAPGGSSLAALRGGAGPRPRAARGLARPLARAALQRLLERRHEVQHATLLGGSRARLDRLA